MAAAKMAVVREEPGIRREKRRPSARVSVPETRLPWLVFQGPLDR